MLFLKAILSLSCLGHAITLDDNNIKPTFVAIAAPENDCCLFFHRRGILHLITVH